MKIKTPFLDVNTDDGDFRVFHEDLAHIPDHELSRLRISRDVLQACFVEGVRLMIEKDWSKCRPCAEELRDGTDDVFGTWEVVIVHYAKEKKKRRIR